MSTALRAAVALAAFAALAPAAPAAPPVPGAGEKAVSFPFPANAPIVAQLTGVGAARERLSAMLRAALPDDAKQIDGQLDAALGQLLADRKLDAVPKNGRAFLAVNDIESLFAGEPSVAVLVPVTGYAEFKATFLTADERKSVEAGKGFDEAKLSVGGGEQAVLMVDLKDYVAITPDKATAELYAGKYARAATAAMPAELARSFIGSDLAVFVNLEAVNAKYGEQIKNFKGLIDFGIAQAQMGGMLPGIGKRQLEAGKSVIGGLFQGVEDARGLVLGVEFRPEGLNLRVQAQFADDTATAGLLKAEKPDPLAEVGKLPAGLGTYTGSRFGKKFGAALKGLSPEFAPADDDADGNAAVDKQLAALMAAGPQGEVSGSAGDGRAVTAATYAKPKEAAAALVGCYEAMSAGGRMFGAVLKDAPKVTKNARAHGGFALAEVRLAFDFEATVKDLPEAAKEGTLAQLKRTLAEQTTVWVGADGETVVQVLERDWVAASAALDAVRRPKKPVGETDGFQRARKQLPADANFLVLAEVGQLAAGLADSLRALEGTVPNFPRVGKVKPPAGDPTFVGVAVTLKGDAATADVFVPVAAIAAARKIAAGLFANVE